MILRVCMYITYTCIYVFVCMYIYIYIYIYNKLHKNILQWFILPEKSHGQRSLAGYNPWGHKDLYMT